jgi:hypothetical protein
MKKLISAVLSVFALSVHATDEPKQKLNPVPVDKKVVCDYVAPVLDAVRNSQYKEIPVWSGSSSDGKSKYIVVANTSTGTWTIIQFNEDIACFIGEGKDSTLVNGKPRI